MKNAASAKKFWNAKLSFFYFFAFLISWAGFIPAALYARGIIPIHSFFFAFIGGGGPALAALLMLALDHQPEHWKTFWGRLKQFGVSLPCYLAAFFTQPLILLAAVVISTLFGWARANPNPALTPWLVFPIFFQTLLSTMWEELGWRAYAFPIHRQHQSFLTAAVLQSLITAVWHLPLWFTPNYPMAVIPFGWWVLEHTAAALVLCYLFERSRYSFPIAAIFHAARNTASTLVFLYFSGIPFNGWLVSMALILGAAVWIALVPHRTLRQYEKNWCVKSD
ncbi:MAG: CPBP family intramembrane metalloprotease [Anaerolineaceae bacterium]|nr:CPBP family intramembrane metalloprotease [Anaerolineaceae bacterium]